MTGALSTREWGSGPTVLAIAPLGLESSAFEGIGLELARWGWRTVAVDLPGFGRTPAPDEPLTPAVLARPVLELARTLSPAPVVLGVSLGGRVALEMALTAPDAVARVIAIAPALPWVRCRPAIEAVRLLDPGAAAWLPLEWAWPVLRPLAGLLERVPWIREDQLAQAGMRLVFYLSCPATRVSFLSAARELALDAPFGPGGLWTRLEHLAVPSAFLWCERDRLVSMRFAQRIARTCPAARQIVLPCAGHWLNGPHHRCVTDALQALLGEPYAAGAPRGVPFAKAPCAALARRDADPTLTEEPLRA